MCVGALERGNAVSFSLCHPFALVFMYAPGSSWYPETTGCKIHWNGTTFIVAEGFGNHPVSMISWIGAWAFSHYYGLRLPTKEEWLKAARGNNDWGFSYGPEPSMYRANTNGSGDPWDEQITGLNYTNKTTPVGFYTVHLRMQSQCYRLPG